MFGWVQKQQVFTCSGPLFAKPKQERLNTDSKLCSVFGGLLRGPLPALARVSLRGIWPQAVSSGNGWPRHPSAQPPERAGIFRYLAATLLLPHFSALPMTGRTMVTNDWGLAHQRTRAVQKGPAEVRLALRAEGSSAAA